MLKVLAFFILMWASSFSATGRPLNTKILKIALQSDIVSFDPIKMDDIFSFHLINQIYEGLFAYNEYGELVPLLAESWKISGDGKKYTITIKDNVYFHNGEKLTADDVIFSLKRITSRENGSINSWLFDGIIHKIEDEISIEKIDDRRLSIELTRPFKGFLDILGSTYAVIVSKKAAITNRESLHFQPVGTGAYKLVLWKKREKIILKQFEHYHGEKPDFAEIKIDLNYKNALQDFNSKKIDLLGAFDGELSKNVARDDVTKKRVYQYITWFLGFNLLKKEFKNPNLRKAIYHLIDKKELVAILGNKDTITDNYFPPGFLFSSKTPFQDSYDIEFAKFYLKKADLPKNFSFEMNIPVKFQQLEKVVNFFKQSFSKANLNVTINTLPLDKFIASFIDKSYEFYILELIPGYADPDSLSYPYFHTKGSFNVINANSKKIDQLIESARYALDPEIRKKIYHELNDYLVNNHYLIPLYHENLDLYYDNKIDDVRISGLSLWYLKYQNLKLKKK